jgi:hypothetical protein
MAAVHQILKRLVARKSQFVSRRDEDGNTLYSFKPDIPLAATRRGYLGVRSAQQSPTPETPVITRAAEAAAVSPKGAASLPLPKTPATSGRQYYTGKEEKK